MNGEFCRNEGTCADCHSGRVVVDSQSMMHVCGVRGQQTNLESEYGTHDLRVVVLVDEHVLEVQVVAVDRELLWRRLAAAAIPLVVRNDAETFHQAQEARHLGLDALHALGQMGDEERRALHAAVVLVHRVARALPLVLALLPVPLVRRVRAVVRERRHLVVPRRRDLVRVEVQPVRRRLALVLEDDALDLAFDAR